MITDRRRSEERTGVQDQAPYDPRYDTGCDFVMVYGIDADMPERIRGYRERGFIVQLMTGVAWGEYQDYLEGRFDGRRHWDEAQMDRQGQYVLHGPTVPYMVPTIAFADYLTERIKPAVDAGVDTIHLEEPELWARSGYSEAFQREYLLYYRKPWQPPHSSPDAQFKASKLKSYLYARALDRICGALKEYAMVRYGRRLRFIVPTHSLISYAQIHMVSPESALMDLPSVDGYIAQVWTGTSNNPNVYRGKEQERVFEMGFLEYGIMQELVRGTNRHMWFLQDPVEDLPTHTWEYYRSRYLMGLTSALLHPHVSHYEICPWPNRVWMRNYPKGGQGIPIPPEYATTLLSTTQALRDMDQEHEWIGGDAALGLLIADSCMFQRIYPDDCRPIHFQAELGSEPAWSSFFGLAMPLVKQGQRVLPVQLDNVRRFPGYLKDYRVLLLSYEFMKPEYPDLHSALTLWVQEGGVLMIVGDGSDPFHRVRHWWNTGDAHYDTPTQHLLETLGLPLDAGEGIHPCGKGAVAVMARHPSELAYDSALSDAMIDLLRQAMAQQGNPGPYLPPKNYFALRRGPYVIASVMQESVSEEALDIPGTFVNLMDHRLSLMQGIRLAPGEVMLAADLSKYPGPVSLVGSAGRVEELRIGPEGFTFRVGATEGQTAALRFLVPSAPKRVAGRVYGEMIPVEWEYEQGTLLLTLAGHPQGVAVEVVF